MGADAYGDACDDGVCDDEQQVDLDVRALYELAGFVAQDSSQAASHVAVLMVVILKVSTSAGHHGWQEEEFNSSRASV